MGLFGGVGDVGLTASLVGDVGLTASLVGAVGLGSKGSSAKYGW